MEHFSFLNQNKENRNTGGQESGSKNASNESTGNSGKPQWMMDPLVSRIDPDKLDFLQSIVFETKGKSQKELFHFLIQLGKSGRLNNISFTEQEMSSIVAAIEKYSTPEELAQIHKFMAIQAKKKKQ